MTTPLKATEGSIRIYETKVLPIDLLRELPNNVNYQTESQFNGLVESIRSNGFRQPIEVAPNADGTFTVVGGNHRLKAVKFLEMKEISCTIIDDLTDTERREFDAVRSNIIRGQIYPVKFTKLFNQYQGKYSKEMLKDMMGFYDEKMFDSLYKQARAALSPHMKEQLDKSKKNIRSIDDLANVLNQLFTEYGETLKHNFMFFNYGGKIHLMVKMNGKLKKIMTKIARLCTHDEDDITTMLCELLKEVDTLYPDVEADGFSRVEEAEPAKPTEEKLS